MADLAVVFHWNPGEMDSMSITELMRWWDEARERATPDE